MSQEQSPPPQMVVVNGSLHAADIVLPENATFPSNLTKHPVFQDWVQKSILDMVPTIIEAVAQDLSIQTHMQQVAMTVVEGAVNDISIGTSDLFQKINRACTGVYSIIENAGAVGSGSFITLTPSDRKFGWCMTAAHVVMKTGQSGRIMASKVYITNPITNDYIEVLPSQIYVDGIADVALIQTNIDLSSAKYDNCVLSLAEKEHATGDPCFVCGNPSGVDNDSFSFGIVRDAHYAEPSGTQGVDTIFVSAPGISGNSGSPIVNESGRVIGIFTFGMSSHETLGGGSSWNTLSATLPVLMSRQNNRNKKYLGLSFAVPNAFTLASIYGQQVRSFPDQGILVKSVSKESPFFSILQPNDVVMSASTPSGSIDFGSSIGQYTLGVLVYLTIDQITLTFIRNNRIRTATARLSKTYKDVPITRDTFLSTLL